MKIEKIEYSLKQNNFYLYKIPTSIGLYNLKRIFLEENEKKVYLELDLDFEKELFIKQVMRNWDLPIYGEYELN